VLAGELLRRWRLKAAMGQKLNQIIDKLSEFLAMRKGLVPLIGILLIIVNFALQFIPGAAGLAGTNLFLHLGIIIALLGIMLAWAL
jgi:hypothetical protein